LAIDTGPMMFQVEHDLVHRHLPLEDHPSRIIQDKARQQA